MGIAAAVLPSCARDLPSDPTRVNVAREEDVPAPGFNDSTGVTLSNGMKERDALAVLIKSGLQPRHVVEASERADKRPFKTYHVLPQGGTDAFRLVLVQAAGGGMVVEDMYWYEDWLHDSRVSKAFRRRKFRPVGDITVREIAEGLRTVTPLVGSTGSQEVSGALASPARSTAGKPAR